MEDSGTGAACEEITLSTQTCTKWNTAPPPKRRDSTARSLQDEFHWWHRAQGQSAMADVLRASVPLWKIPEVKTQDSSVSKLCARSPRRGDVIPGRREIVQSSQDSVYNSVATLFTQ